MEKPIETIAVILFFNAALWYLYRRFKSIFSSDQPSCSHCDGCSTAKKIIEKHASLNEEDHSQTGR
jgi:hypothetical protein